MRENRLQKKWAALFAAVLLGLFALSFFANPHSEPDDDWTIAYLVAGRMGPLGMSPHMGPVLLEVLKLAARALPWLNVYEAFRMLLTLGALAAFAICLFRLLQPGQAFFFGSLVVFIYWKDIMLRYNYTYCAGLCAGAAVLLLYCFGAGRMKKAAAVFGLIFWLLALEWRPEAALLLLPYGGLLLAAGGLRAARERGGAKMILRSGRPLALALLAAALLTGALLAYSGLFWSRPEWSEYRRYNRARVAAVDYSLAPWDEAREELEPLGITQNDYWCAQNWIGADPEVFSLEHMEAIAAQKITADHSGNFWRQAAQYFLRAPFRVRACSAFVLAALLVFLTGGVRQWLIVLCAAAGSGVISLYFLWQGRLIDRVEAVIWLGALCVAATQISPFARRGKKAALAACGVGGGLLLALTAWRMLPLQAPNGLLRTDFEPSDPVAVGTMEGEDYYLWSVMQDELVWAAAYSNTNLPSTEFFAHNGGLGGWSEGSPALKALRRELGLENPIRALVEEKNVYLVDSYSPLRVLELIRQHYEPKAALSAARQLGENVWALAFTPPACGERAGSSGLDAGQPGTGGGGRAGSGARQSKRLVQGKRQRGGAEGCRVFVASDRGPGRRKPLLPAHRAGGRPL